LKNGFSTGQIKFAIIGRYFDVDWAKWQLHVGTYTYMFLCVQTSVQPFEGQYAANAGVSTSAAGLEDATQ